MSNFPMPLIAAAGLLLAPKLARADAPYGKLLSLDRLVTGAVTWGEIHPGDARSDFTEYSSSVVGFGAQQRYGYAMPRLGVGFLTEFGLSFTFSFGFSSSTLEIDDIEVTTESSLLNPRLGFYLPISEEWALWPQAGVSLRFFEASGLEESMHTSITLELPVSTHEVEGVEFSLGVYSELGLGGGSDAVDETVHELGLSFGVHFIR